MITTTTDRRSARRPDNFVSFEESLRAAAKNVKFPVGSRVRHNKHGEGLVIDIMSDGRVLPREDGHGEMGTE